MGNRVSVSFKNGDRESVALFHHWGGMEFVEEARGYILKLHEEVAGKQTEPLDRCDPQTVMVDFISRCATKGERISRSIYLGKDDCDGDNSDNGHFALDLVEPASRFNVCYEEKTNYETEVEAKDANEARDIVLNHVLKGGCEKSEEKGSSVECVSINRIS